MSLANPCFNKPLLGRGGGERSERRGPCPGSGCFRKPGSNPYEVERCASNSRRATKPSNHADLPTGFS
jgi:hypothetical protein